MSRVDQSITARTMMGEDFFGGWEASDIKLFSEFALASEPMVGKITDFMGIRTSTGFHPWAIEFDNKVLSDLPLPDDRLRAEAIEYFALFDALQRAPGESFAMAEIGSSYAPWSCAAAVCSARMGKSNINITAVEASSYLVGLIPEHLLENGVDPSIVNIINGACTTERTQLFFPVASNPGENGGQATTENLETDYLNRNVEYESVEGYPLDELLPVGIVDLLHIDIQGHEFEVLHIAPDSLYNRVRNIFIGTHSRKIEGQLLELLHSKGWQLVRERPTRFSYSSSHGDIVGWTTRDGGQYWHNPKI